MKESEEEKEGKPREIKNIIFVIIALVVAIAVALWFTL